MGLVLATDLSWELASLLCSETKELKMLCSYPEKGFNASKKENAFSVKVSGEITFDLSVRQNCREPSYSPLYRITTSFGSVLRAKNSLKPNLPCVRGGERCRPPRNVRRILGSANRRGQIQSSTTLRWLSSTLGCRRRKSRSCTAGLRWRRAWIRTCTWNVPSGPRPTPPLFQ